MHAEKNPRIPQSADQLRCDADEFSPHRLRHCLTCEEQPYNSDTEWYEIFVSGSKKSLMTGLNKFEGSRDRLCTAMGFKDLDLCRLTHHVRLSQFDTILLAEP